MKKILILVSFLTLTTLSLHSQTYSFVLDTIQPFKCPSNLSVNEAARLNKFKYFETIKIVKGGYDNKDGWVYVEFIDPNNNRHRLGIGNEKGTNKKIVIVTALDDDITIQKGYFGYPMNYTINPSTR